jgi:integrase
VVATAPLGSRSRAQGCAGDVASRCVDDSRFLRLGPGDGCGSGEPGDARVHTGAVHNRQPRPVSDAIFTKLWDTLDGADAIVLGLASFCGLRREEITRLRVLNVDVGTRKLVNFVRKGGGEDTLPIGTMLATFEQRLPHLGAECLWTLIVERNDGRDRAKFLIGWSDLGRPRRSVAASLREVDALDPNHLNHWLDRMASQASVPHIAPHQLRHSCATNLLRAGVPLPIASNLLNHANVHTTMRYMKAGGDELREWLTNTTPPNRRRSRRDRKLAATAGV